jgi:hypothetical protein
MVSALVLDRLDRLNPYMTAGDRIPASPAPVSLFLDRVIPVP